MSIDDIPDEPDTPEGANTPEAEGSGDAPKKASAGKKRAKPASPDRTEIAPSAVEPKPVQEAEGFEDAVPPKPVEEAPVKSGDGGGTPSTAVPVGTRINNNYEIEELVSAGGMGEVYRGVNYHTGDQVAIKIVLPALAHDEKIITLFRREARILGKLYDEAIVRYLNFVKDEDLGRFCLIMEFVDGIPLSDMMEQTGALSLDDVKLLIRRLATGLNRAHELEITHRDLSPDNVIVEGGKLNHAKLIDFGIAKSTKITEGTLHGQFAGKFNFVSPEQLGHFDGVVDARSDIYSLGLMAAGAALGKALPMGASIVDAVQSRAGIPDLSAVYPELQPVLSYMLEPNPANRPSTMAEVARMVDDPTLVPAQYRLDGADVPAVDADPAMGRTVISPMISSPPQMQTGVPAGVAPVTSAVPYSADSTGVASTGAGLSLPPDPSMMGQQTGAPTAESPFGAAPMTSAPTPQSAPEPEAAVAKSGGSGKLIGLGLAALVVGGVGVAAVMGLGPFGGGDDLPAGGEQVAVATPDPTPVPTPDPDPTPDPTPDPVPEPDPDLAPVTPDPIPEPDPVPDPVPTPDPQPDPTPIPVAPDLALGEIGTQLAWLKDYITDDCVYQAIRSTDGDSVSIEGFATSPAPFEVLLKDFEAAHGVEPDIGVRIVRDSQCPVLDFVTRLGRSGASSPVLELDTDVLKSGDTLSGKLTGVLGRPVYLFLVSAKGGAFNLTSLLQPEPDGSQSFRFGMNSSGEDGSVPQMIVAVTTRSRLVTANAARNGADVAALMPIIETEIQTSGSDAAASVQYFRLDN
ncbi:protein kinase domain-containing protein [Litoreibacter janthinus]|uniref:Serine/threonine protein kinase n=1 Tax=Litoreibacter janthinus TaxID=670154 RepID=A0A1I6IE52_9RHOB|nr:protein kinase [Litoreibacter janthinus]SFR64914.1 Serine/threonine protein kinase [Litoreibacter janthinus]